MLFPLAQLSSRGHSGQTPDPIIALANGADWTVLGRLPHCENRVVLDLSTYDPCCKHRFSSSNRHSSTHAYRDKENLESGDNGVPSVPLSSHKIETAHYHRTIGFA
jgi:hypothetical protein